MEINWSIAGWIIAILVFYTIGFYEGRSTGYKKRQREEEQESAKTQPTPVAVKVDPVLLKPNNKTLTQEFDSTGSLTPEYDQRLTAAVTPPVPQPPLSQPLPASTNQASTPLPPISFKPAAKSAEPAAEKKPAPPPTSIVGQINLVLQEKLAGSPLEDRGISMSQSAEGGVIVTVGASQYFGVDDVPDAEIKSFIRTAIKEWEKKYTPGL